MPEQALLGPQLTKAQITQVCVAAVSRAGRPSMRQNGGSVRLAQAPLPPEDRGTTSCG